jgi:large conductance mechanosensitive channel
LNKDILTPLIAVFGGKDFSNLQVLLGEGEEAPILTYGNFITSVINFLTTAFILFCILKIVQMVKKRFEKKEAVTPKPPTTKKCPYCVSEIAIEATRCPYCTSILSELSEQVK